MLKVFPELFSRSRKPPHKVRTWNLIVDGGSFVVTHGIQDGKQQIKETVCKPKNIGKSNETTVEEQALIEATAKHKFQIMREDYALTPEGSNLQIRPMLALDATKVGHRVKWAEGVIAQPKLDGLRLTYGKRWIDREADNEFMSRKGDTYQVDHLTESCNYLLSHLQQFVNCISVDGELYIHGLPLQKIVSYAKKYKSGLTEQLQYYLFDLIIPDMTFENRYKILEDAFNSLPPEHQRHFVLVPCTDKILEEDIDFVQGTYIADGYEGTILRHTFAMYGIGERSPDLFKYKEFKDDECKIVGMFEDKNGNAVLECQLKNGLFCDVTPKRTFPERKQMLIDRDDYIGKWITVKYFDTTEAGNLQFPIGLDLRECNDDGIPID